MRAVPNGVSHVTPGAAVPTVTVRGEMKLLPLALKALNTTLWLPAA